MNEFVWSGWLQKKSGDPTGLVSRFRGSGRGAFDDRYFVLDKTEISYYVPPASFTRNSVLENPPTSSIAALGFTKKGSIDLSELINLTKPDDLSLRLELNSGRIYEVLAFDENQSRNDLIAFEAALDGLGFSLDMNMDNVYQQVRSIAVKQPPN